MTDSSNDMTIPVPAEGTQTAERIGPEIALLQLGKIGDMILTTPLFDGLRAVYPDAKLTVIADEGNMLIPSSHPAVDEVIGIPGGIMKLFAMANRLRRKKFDLYIDPKDQSSTTSRFTVELIDARTRVVSAPNASGKHATMVLPPPAPPEHFVDAMLAPLALLAPDRTFSRRPTLPIPTDAFMAVDRQIDPSERGLVVVNVSAGSPTRYWEPAKWRTLIDEIAKHHNVAVISSPADRSFVDEVCSNRKSAHAIWTETILEAGAAIARAVAVVTPDTSIVHLAAVLDRPVVGLYPPLDWNARRFAPLSHVNRMLMPKADQPLSTIPVADVLAALEEILEENWEVRRQK